MGTLSVFDQLPTPSVTMTTDERGVITLESDMPLLAYSRRIGDWLIKWAGQKPDTVFIAERAGTDCVQASAWRTLTYGEFYRQVQHLAQGMINAGLDGSRPVIVISGNSVDHALVKMAAMHIGIPVTSLSVAYSMFPGKYERLVSACERLNPALVFAQQGRQFSQALSALNGDHQVLVSDGQQALPEVRQKITTLAAMMDCPVTEQVQQRFEATGAENPAKYMLTSGSTGHPKVVVVTQRMMCANQQMIAQCWPFLEKTPPVVLDWLPWSHTFGTNHNFNLVLRNGGSFYIDEGRPMPGLVEKMAANIKAVKPTLFFNVPKGYEALLPLLQTDKKLAGAFFANLQLVFYAAASLSDMVWCSLRELARHHGRDPLFSTEWGSTETAPANTNVHWRLEHAGNIGVPMPGVSLKMVPNGSKLEVRVKGPNIFREYLQAPDKTAESFDNDGYYRIGDAGRMADPENPSAGIIFDGRVSEDFKLSTGTWVCVATMRKRVIEAFDGLVSDALITGHDQDYIGLVVFPGPDIRRLAGDITGSGSGKELLSNQIVRSTFESALAVINARARGSSQKIQKVVLADSEPSLLEGEITDKGNLNQRKLLDTRRDLITRIYSDSSCDSIVISD